MLLPMTGSICPTPACGQIGGQSDLVAGSEGVEIDPRLNRKPDSCFGGNIRRISSPTHEHGGRAYIDNPPLAGDSHGRYRRASNDEASGQIHGDHFAPFLKRQRQPAPVRRAGVQLRRSQRFVAKSVMTKAGPRAARSRAKARPSPCPAPVIATAPAESFMSLLRYRRLGRKVTIPGKIARMTRPRRKSPTNGQAAAKTVVNGPSHQALLTANSV